MCVLLKGDEIGLLGSQRCVDATFTPIPCCSLQHSASLVSLLCASHPTVFLFLQFVTFFNHVIFLQIFQGNDLIFKDFLCSLMQ